ncbi:hypothetical protein PTKIN_Ptkin05aG0056400 [Pterospermum kingtungense]
MDRRLPRSPALKSPVLSPKSPALYEKYKSGCAWGLIHFFDFRQGHSHGKLISNKNLPNRQAKGDGYTRNRPNFIFNEKKDQYKDDALGNKNLAVNSRKPEVKKENTAIAEMQNLQFNPKLVGHSKDNRKASKSSKKSCPFPACGCDAAAEAYMQPSDRNLVGQSTNRNKLVSLTEASGNDVHVNNGSKRIRGRKQDHHREINLRAHMNEAVEAFVNQNLTDGEGLSGNEVANQSKNFVDALEVLNSNKELFMKLLQDPNSLLVKHIQNLRDSQVKKQPQSSSKGKISQCQPNGTGEYEGPANAPLSESCDRRMSEGSDMPQPLNTIVVLKAGTQNCPDRISNWPLPQCQFSLRKKERSIGPAFLSFEHMKRKLSHAMRVNKKEQDQMSLDGNHNSPHDFEEFEDCGKEMTNQVNERIHDSKSYLNVEKMYQSSHEVNRRDGMGQAENFGSGIGSKAASSAESCNRTSNLPPLRHLKGKLHHRKHLSDMLHRGNEDFSRQLRTLDRLMSLPEYDLLPALNPGRDKEHVFAYPQMRFSPYSNFSTVYGYEWRVQREKKTDRSSSSLSESLGAQPALNDGKPDDHYVKNSISGEVSSATELLQTVHFHDEDMIEKVMQINHAVSDEHESNALEVGLEPNILQNTNTNQRTEAVNISGESEYFEGLILDSPLGDQTSSSSIDVYSSSPLHTQRAEESDSMIDRAERPSPMSVLEQFSVEDNTSSPSTVSLAAEPSAEPFCIEIEELYASSLAESHLDLKSKAVTSMDKHGSLSEGIRAVLQISGLNWEELSRKWHLLDQMLDSSFFDNVEGWPEKSSTDRKLLLGYINEVLLEIHQSYSRCSPWVSLLNPIPQLAFLSKNMVHEVLRHVDWPLLSELPKQTVQQLVEKDLAKSRTWMDIQLDTEEIVTELVDSIVEDLVVDAAIRLQT